MRQPYTPVIPRMVIRATADEMIALGWVITHYVQYLERERAESAGASGVDRAVARVSRTGGQAWSNSVGGAAMSEERQAPRKPTYRELWYDVGGTLLDVWEGTTQLDVESLCGLWNHLPVPRYMAERAINEYNQLFKASYTLDQVDIPTLEALGYGRQFHVHEGEVSLGVSWTWVKL